MVYQSRGGGEKGGYLVQDVVASLAGGDLDEPVQTLGGLLDQEVPATRVVPLATQTHHLDNRELRR